MSSRYISMRGRPRRLLSARDLDPGWLLPEADDVLACVTICPSATGQGWASGLRRGALREISPALRDCSAPGDVRASASDGAESI
jgi:hypothetical protein